VSECLSKNIATDHEAGAQHSAVSSIPYTRDVTELIKIRIRRQCECECY